MYTLTQFADTMTRNNGILNDIDYRKAIDNRLSSVHIEHDKLIFNGVFDEEVSLPKRNRFSLWKPDKSDTVRCLLRAPYTCGYTLTEGVFNISPGNKIQYERFQIFLDDGTLSCGIVFCVEDLPELPIC